jgi:hypothetical protein
MTSMIPSSYAFPILAGRDRLSRLAHYRGEEASYGRGIHSHGLSLDIYLVKA